MNLNELRRQIDDTDDRILKLFLSRMELAGRVAEYKASSGLPVLHKGREEEILNRLAERADEQADCVKALFST
ncbi:MAG TPA: hypothetical protein DEQ02_00800, partial [Ruminococcaceae bacterium]|nr:hypothetical protein [Oscillospiraceae bacterium]